MQDPVLRLETTTVDVVIKTHPFAEILYWGPHLQHFSPQDVATLARPVANGRLDVALHFAERRRTGNQRREVLVGGFTPTIFNHEAVVFKLNAVRLKLSDPASVEGHHLLRALGHRQRDGETVNLPGDRFQVR